MRVTVSVDILSIYTIQVRESQWHTLRHKVAQRRGWRCHWCGCDLACHLCDRETWLSGVAMATLEHITPRAEGGAPAAMHNLALACQPCNSCREHGATPERLANARAAEQRRRDRQVYPVVWNARLGTFVVDYPPGAPVWPPAI